MDYLAVDYLSLGYSLDKINDQVLGFTSDTASSYVEYNKSLELSILRNGPIIGTMPNMWNDYIGKDEFSLGWVVNVDAQRQIRCYSWYNLFWTPLAIGSSSGNYTKCIRTGSGWGDANKKASFSVSGAYDAVTQKQGPGVSVEIYSSDRAVFFPNGTLPSNVPAACLTKGSVLNRTVCNWDKIFTTDLTSPIFNRTQNVNTIEMKMDNGNLSTTFAVDFVAFLNFTTYSTDPFPDSNPLRLVQTQQLPTTGKNIAVDPNWVLAAWSTVEGGTLLPNRTSSNLLVDVLSYQLAHPDIGMATDTNKNDFIAILPVMHTLSLIDHSSVFVPDGTKPSAFGADHPLLVRNARMYAWAYGMGSRTSYVGAVVTIAGALVVVMQFVLGFTDRRHYRSPTQLLVAALEHSPRGEFSGKQHDETAMARVRFHIQDNHGQAGKYSFHEPYSS